jgi:hypothetical protein
VTGLEKRQVDTEFGLMTVMVSRNRVHHLGSNGWDAAVWVDQLAVTSHDARSPLEGDHSRRGAEAMVWYPAARLRRGG